MHPEYTPRVATRFWSKVDRRGPNDCWPWTAYRMPNGYGAFGVGRGDTKLAHRMAWMLTHGAIPDGLAVCHTCDNRPCCNPAHLWLGTAADNLQDMADKGVRKGERHALVKLTEAQVRAIRAACAAGALHADIAWEYGVSRQTVDFIANRKRWGHI